MLDTINYEQKTTKAKANEKLHDIKILSNQLFKLCQENQIPFFLTYYHPAVGYQYNGLFPEEIDSENVSSEYFRFVEFLKIVVNFNKEDYKPIIKKNQK